MPVNIDEGNLKQGLMGLVVALVEIIQEVLERQAIRRMEGGRLSEQEIERLGAALSDLKEALTNIKKDNDLEDAVNSIREDLDDVAGEMVDKFNTESRNEGVIEA
ncbi:MAG: gas vesicle protein K [Candidatus Methanoperedens sp.]|nr:gas vesicle protein K [Candidatus Methanoperedens sp.]MCZ7404912.1 gas vesicle protein K [Candidatus Methanoperedens sp.]